MYSKADLIQSGMPTPMADSVIGNIERLLDADLKPVLISQSYSPVTRSSTNGVGTNDTDFQTLASVTVPGGTMNKNGLISVEQDWKYTNSTSIKTLAMDWGGANVSWGTAGSGVVRSCYRIAIKNTNSLTAQNVFNNTTYGNAAADAAPAINTANDVLIDHKCKWSANVASEQIILLGYSIWYYPGND